MITCFKENRKYAVRYLQLISIYLQVQNQNLCKEEDMCEHPVRKAAINDDVKLMEFLLTTSYDMNSEIWFGQTAFHVACDYGSKKVAKLIMESSGKYGIGNVNNLSI